MSLISNCGHNESGKLTGGKPGDQTGGEWALIPWYSRPWNVVLRHPDPKVRAKLSELAKKAAKNNLVGYCQTHRGTYWTHLKASHYDPSQITIACEADCSSGVLSNIRAVGYLLNISSFKNVSLVSTSSMRKTLKALGFEALTDSKNTLQARIGSWRAIYCSTRDITRQPTARMVRQPEKSTLHHPDPEAQAQRARQM